MAGLAGLGGVAVIVLILAQWTTNTTNLYSAGLSFASISERLSRRTVTIVLGAIGIIVGVIGAADYFVQFILVIGTIIAPAVSTTSVCKIMPLSMV